MGYVCVAADELSADDRQILRVFAFKTRARLTREAFAMLPFAFDSIPDESEAEVDARTAFLSGIYPVLYNCCPRSCCCYVGPYADFRECPISHSTPRRTLP